MKKFQNHLDELCTPDDVLIEQDAVLTGAKGPTSESIAPGATIHEEVMTPFPGLQETPLHAV